VFNLEPSSAYGARLAWWATPRVGLEGSLVGSAATLRLIGGSALETSGTLFEGDGRLRLRLNSPAAAHHFDAIGGVGISDTQFDLSDFLARSGLKRKARTTWVAGLGTTFGLGSNLGLRIDLEDHISPTHFEFDPGLTNTPQKDRTQHEVLWMMGLVVPLGGS
jgi:hypothetical protein